MTSESWSWKQTGSFCKDQQLRGEFFRIVDAGPVITKKSKGPSRGWTDMDKEQVLPDITRTFHEQPYSHFLKSDYF